MELQAHTNFVFLKIYPRVKYLALAFIMPELAYIVVQSIAVFDFFVTTWTVACQASMSMRFPKQDYGVGFHFLLQGIS